MIKRYRRSDGFPFFGCSRFPECRRTEPDLEYQGNLAWKPATIYSDEGEVAMNDAFGTIY